MPGEAMRKWATADMNKKMATPQATLTSKRGVTSGGAEPGGPAMYVAITGSVNPLASQRTKKAWMAWSAPMPTL